ncbi:hypothetical protein E4U52_002439 [Claviceps spartinae]|nr:hypothetical protein E4U52_002439 [Claviceps spartinae]
MKESPDTSRQVATGIENSIPPIDPLVPWYSVNYDNPTKDLEITRNTQSTRPPVFQVVSGDPVMVAISNAIADTASEANQAGSGGRVRVPFISATYRHRRDGCRLDGPPSYEQDLCKRSNLRQTLATSRPGEDSEYHHRISATGCIFSDTVVVHLGPRGNNEWLEPPHDLPVVSVPPLQRPLAIRRGTMYKNDKDKNMMKERMCGALRICLYHNYDRVVIGDFGLGEVCRNPPQALAEIWRDLLLFDPVLRGQFAYVVFAFEDPTQSTTQCHWDNLLRVKERQRSLKLAAEGTSSKSTRRTAKRSHSVPRAPTDMAVFQSVFHPDEIERVLQMPDPRCSIAMVLS